MKYPIKIQDVTYHDIFNKTLTSKKDFFKEDYCRHNRKYYASDYADISDGTYFKKDRIVFVEYDETYERNGILKCAEYSKLPLNY